MERCFVRALLLLLASWASLSALVTAAPGAPLVIVPGDTGSKLRARLTRDRGSPVPPCPRHTDWFTLWANLTYLGKMLPCFTEFMGLNYNAETHTTFNCPGVELEAPGFGNTSTIEHLDDTDIPLFAYFASMVEALVKMGYTRGDDVVGAPYDWRKAANEHSDYFMALKQLIESLYQKNSNKQVVLLGHSMGNNMILYFLSQQSQDWKQKFVKSYIDIAGPIDGSAKSLLALISGYNMGDFLVKGIDARAMERSFPSTIWMMPNAPSWTPQEVLVSTTTKNYTTADYSQLFADMNYTTGWTVRNELVRVLKGPIPPGVEVHCLHGSQVPTMETFTYGKGQFPDETPTYTTGDGDGTVNARSLMACLRWANQQTMPVHHKVFPKVDHVGTVKNPDVIQYVKSVLTS